MLELDRSGIHVAEYLTELPPREVLTRKLHEAINRSRLLYESHTEELSLQAEPERIKPAGLKTGKAAKRRKGAGA